MGGAGVPVTKREDDAMVSAHKAMELLPDLLPNPAVVAELNSQGRGVAVDGHGGTAVPPLLPQPWGARGGRSARRRKTEARRDGKQAKASRQADLQADGSEALPCAGAPPIHRLSDDLLLIVLTRVPLTDDVARCASVCNRWRQLLKPLYTHFTHEPLSSLLRHQPPSSLSLNLTHSLSCKRLSPHHTHTLARMLNSPAGCNLRVSFLRLSYGTFLSTFLPTRNPSSSTSHLPLSLFPPYLASLAHLAIDSLSSSTDLPSLLSLHLPSLTRLAIDIAMPSSMDHAHSLLACSLPHLPALLHLDLSMLHAVHGTDRHTGPAKACSAHDLLNSVDGLLSQVPLAACARLQQVMRTVACMQGLRRLSLTAITVPNRAALRVVAASLPLTHLQLDRCKVVNKASVGEGEEGGDEDPDVQRSNPLLCFSHLQELDVVTSVCSDGSFCFGLSDLTALWSLSVQVHNCTELDHVSLVTSLTSLRLRPRMAASAARPRSIVSRLHRLSSLRCLSLHDFPLQDLSAVLAGAAAPEAKRRLPLLTLLSIASSSPYATLNLQGAIAQSVGSLTCLQELSLDPLLSPQSLLSLKRLTSLTRLTLGNSRPHAVHKRFDTRMAEAVGHTLVSLQCLEVKGQWALDEKALQQVVRLLPGLKQIVLPADMHVCRRMLDAATKRRIVLKYPRHAQDE